MYCPKIFTAIISILCLMLVGCASSNVSREAAANVDLGIRNAKDFVDPDRDLAGSYQNSSQMAQGAVIGGAAGALTSYFSGVGVLPGTAIGAILGASYGRYLDVNTNLCDRLENRGVTIVMLGDQVLMVIPSARIFRPFTSTIKQEAHDTLAMVTKYINSFIKTTVKVTAYTQNTDSAKVDFALTQQQAESVMKFLENCGLNARLLYAVGCGSTHLVTRDSPDWYGNDNYRIEITFEKLYA